jgi:hypothetical protein
MSYKDTFYRSLYTINLNLYLIRYLSLLVLYIWTYISSRINAVSPLIRTDLNIPLSYRVAYSNF